MEFRTIDGSGNNLQSPQINATNSDEIRVGPANFAPGTGNGLIDGPNPRTISNVMASGSNAENTDPDLSAMMYAFGQFVDHDIDLNNPDGSTQIGITVPAGDPDLSPGSTIAMTRGITDPANGLAVNAVTGWLDLSQIYGSDPTTASMLRGSGGLLATSDGDNLPQVNGSFIGGDVRTTENPDLTGIITLFAREHNFWVGKLHAADPSLTDDQLYQQAKAITTAEYQNIVYQGYLPHLLGSGAPGAYPGYDPTVDPRLTEEFTTAAYRYGHSIVSGTETKIDNAGNVLGKQSLADAFFNTPAQDASNGGVDALVRNLASDYSQADDVYAIPELRNLLAASPDAMDLIAIDIQRERDLGIGTLNQTRAALGMTPYTRFDQITSDPQVAAHLQQVYGSVDQVDLFVGGLAENHVDGGMVGQTFEAIIGQQFEALRDGDRLFWQNQGFSPAMSQQIQDTTLSDLIERDTDTPAMQADAFVAATRHASDVAGPAAPGAAQLVIGTDADGATIAGGSGDDTLVAGLGYQQIMRGNGGHDSFVFDGPGHVATVTDFQPAQDTLDFVSMTPQDFAAMTAAPTADGSMTMQLGGNSITLTGVPMGSLSAANIVMQTPDHSLPLAVAS